MKSASYLDVFVQTEKRKLFLTKQKFAVNKFSSRKKIDSISCFKVPIFHDFAVKFSVVHKRILFFAQGARKNGTQDAIARNSDSSRNFIYVNSHRENASKRNRT